MTAAVPRLRVPIVALLCLTLALTYAATASGPASADDLHAVPEPTVEGPVAGAPPGDPASDVLEETYPFFATDVDLAAHGYVEEEFFISGTANQYADGEIVSTHPYRTRVVVRRPVDPQHFSGTAILEWQNVTAGYDLDALWAPSAAHYIRSGYAWVGVSAQNVGVSFLTNWSPTRYGDLDVTDGGQVTGDALSFDIYSQAAQAVWTGAIMGDLEVDQVLGIGASQSAAFMTTYYSDVLPLIEPVFDGYAYVVGNAPAPANGRDEPIFQVVSENDVLIGLGGAARAFPQTDLFRRWEVAGTGHSGAAGDEARRAIAARDLGATPEDDPVLDCAIPARSRMPLHHVLHAAYDHLSVWATDGTPPPIADFIEGGPFSIVRDELGLALGGIRLSQLEVPTAVNSGANSGPQFCVLFGSHVPFDEDTLNELYPSHGRYVSEVNGVENRNVRDGFIVRADSQENRRAAAQSDISR